MRMRPVWSRSRRPVACANVSTIKSSASARDAPSARAASAIGRSDASRLAFKATSRARPSPFGFMPPRKKVEAEVEVARVLGIEPEERHRRGAQLRPGVRRFIQGLIDAAAEIGEGALQHLGVNRLLRVEVKIEGRGRIARLGRDRARLAPSSPSAANMSPGRLQDQSALVVGDRLPPLLPEPSHVHLPLAMTL